MGATGPGHWEERRDQFQIKGREGLRNYGVDERHLENNQNDKTGDCSIEGLSGGVGRKQMMF